MNGELIWVLSLLAVAIVLFATGRVRMDAVALFVIVAFALSGTLTVPEVFSGFSDPNVVLIAALFIIGDGLVRTGVATVMGTWLVKVAGNSEIKMLVLLMLTVAGLGAFMSSTGVVAIFIPVVLSVAMRMQTSPSRLMMPLSFAGLISGMMTLVATPPNLVVNSELLREGYHGFSFFSVTPIGLVVLVLGILYMLVMRFMLKGDTQTPQREGWTRRTFRDLIREYRLTGRARRLAIRPGSPMIGQRLDDLKLRERYGANVIGVERWRRFRRVIVNVNGVSEFRARDVLLIDMSAADVDLRQFCSEQLLEPMVLRGEYFSDQALDVGMAEISLIPESELIGKSVREIGFRTRYGLNVVGLKRNGVALAVKGLMDIGGGYGPHMMLGCLFVLSAVIGLFISNTATAVLMAPIALAAAKTMGVSPYPFAMVVAMAASAAFMTPISSPVNTLVLGPGNYSFSDFVKLGVPFTIIVMAVCVVMIPMLFPF